MEPTVVGDHARSFGWLILIIATLLATAAVVGTILGHWVLGNPSKIVQQAPMLAILLMLVLLIATPGLFLVAGASQSVVAALAAFLARRHGRHAQALALLAVPAAAVLTWYCFDYLTPSDVALVGAPRSVRYEHGLTLSRYARITAFQAAVTLFTVVYTATATKKCRRWLPSACCAVAFGVGSGIAAVQVYPMWVKEVAARRTLGADIERKTIPIGGGRSIRTIDWTPDGKSLLVRMILPDEIVTVNEAGQSSVTLPPVWSANAVNTVGTKIFTTTWSPNGSYLESLDLTTMHAERKLIDTVPHEDLSERPEPYIGPSRSIKAIPLTSPLNIVRDRPHVVDLYDGTTLTKIASFGFAVGQPLPGLVSVSADGKEVAYCIFTSSDAGAIEVRSVPDGAVLGKLEGSFDTVAALSPDGKNVAAVEQRPAPDGTGKSTKWITIYDIASRKVVGAREIRGACAVQRWEDDWCRDYLPPTWSPDGGFVAYADGPIGQNTLRLWHPFGAAETDRDLLIKVPFNHIALSPDGSAVAVDDFDDSVTVIRSRNGRPL